MELLSLATAFYGFRVCHTWEKFSHSFCSVFLVSCASILEHFFNTLFYFGKVNTNCTKYFLFLDRCAATLAGFSRYKTVENKLCFILKEKTIFTFMLYVTLDLGFWDGPYYDFVHGIWHLLVFSLLDRNYK